MSQKLISALDQLEKTLKFQGSFKQSFLRGLYSGIGSVVGATLIAGIIITILLKIITTVRQLPFIDQFIQNISSGNTFPQ